MPTPTVITDLDPVAANNFPAGSNAPSVLDDVQRAHGAFIRQLLNATQSNAYTAVTAGGTSTAVTLTPSPAITAYAAGQSFWVTFGTALGVSPTINISGLGATVNLVYRKGDGTYANISGLPAGAYRVTLVSTTQALVESGVNTPTSFRADNNGVNILSIPDITYTRIALSTERHDTNAEFSAGTFTAKRPGFHRFFFQFATVNPLAGAPIRASLYVNGGRVLTDYKILQGTNTETTSVYGEFLLAVGDTVDTYVYHGRGTGEDIFGSTTATYFTGGYTGV